MSKNSINQLEQDHYQQMVAFKIRQLPYYIRDFFLEKHYSITTQYQYLTEFTRFFTWLVDNQISSATTIKDIPLVALNDLKTRDINLYIDFLMHTSNQQGHANSPAAVNRSINSLRSLFKYLTVTSENDDGQPYLTNNVMLKIALLRSNETLNLRAKKIERQMFRGHLKHDLLDFIQNEYAGRCSGRALASFKINKERDLALIAILFGTAARRSEIANLNVSDINLKEHSVIFLRKGGMRDIVPFSNWITPYINDYLAVRKQCYRIKDSSIKPLFVTRARGKLHRLTALQINNIVKKYTTAFGRPSTPHKLRHTTASELFEHEKDIILVAQQLGQSGTSATALYTHVDKEKQRDAMNQLK